MDYLLTVSLSLALLVAVVVLLRERRLRLALQRLVHRLLSLWRSDERSQTDEIDRLCVWRSDRSLPFGITADPTRFPRGTDKRRTLDRRSFARERSPVGTVPPAERRTGGRTAMAQHAVADLNAD